MYLSRSVIRQFVAAVEWVTPRNIVVLCTGRYQPSDTANIIVRSELSKLTRTKRVPPLKRLPCASGAVYADYYSRKKNIGTFKFDHDSKLRDCLAKYLKDRNYEGISDISLEPPSDATLGKIRFEFDNGHMSPAQLEDKLVRHYSKPGNYQVVFIMGSRYLTEKEEIRRLLMILEIISRLFPRKPNKILAATYKQFIENGKVLNFKGEEQHI